MFGCKHEWKILSDLTTESKVEHAAKIGLNVTSGDSDLLNRSQIQTLTCGKCGKLKRYVNKI